MERIKSVEVMKFQTLKKKYVLVKL